ncbi:SulP family inorganic anion transporter [Siccibacter turicensis]|uniref:SulP family inorganic anion transporter n=1 Tax=Siccibacter turicensis TaxID=357233 RepID=UPI001F0CE72D|nr:SulP family inorganic anion transporter [Siccibacter turicensis]
MWLPKLLGWMPGLDGFIHYRKANIRDDIRAGLSVSAVALPVAIAYTQVMGINPVIGLYACILPMMAYALFGTSRQLIVGPDMAACVVIASVTMPLARGDSNLIWELTIIMTLMTGLWCLLGGYLRLAIFADFLSPPILQGLLNGVAATIVVSQMSNILGIAPLSSDVIASLMALPGKLAGLHWLTLLLSLTSLALLLLLQAYKPRWPAPLILMVLGTILSGLFDFHAAGIAIIGDVGQRLPHIHTPTFDPLLLKELLVPSLNLAVISVASYMMTVRSFAEKNHYDVDIDMEMRALGYINIASGLSQGYAVSAATSRTAVNDVNGGKTQMVSIIAALMIALVLFFLTQYISYIPLAVLGAVLIFSSLSMFSLTTLYAERKTNPADFFLAAFTFLAVLVVGLVDGIGFAILLGLLQFLRKVFRPTDLLLGLDDAGVIRSMRPDNDIQPVPEALVYRFNSPLTYFNTGYFKKRIHHLIDDSPSSTKWVIIDAASSFVYNDSTVMKYISELAHELQGRGMTLILAGRSSEIRKWLVKNQLAHHPGSLILVPDLYFALRLIQNHRAQHEITEQIEALDTGLTAKPGE